MLGRLTRLAKRTSPPFQSLNDVAVASLLEVLAAINLPKDIGVPELSYRRDVRFYHLYEDNDVTIGMFVLGKGASIPLHDHPNMAVLSRVLFGQLHVRSYDYLEGYHNTPTVGEIRTCRLHRDELFDSGKTFALFPHLGNIHSFHAPAAMTGVLEVQKPRYDERERPCSYFRVAETAAAVPAAAFDGTIQPQQAAAAAVAAAATASQPPLSVTERIARGASLLRPRRHRHHTRTHGRGRCERVGR